jgi:hypothetical protein
VAEADLTLPVAGGATCAHAAAHGQDRTPLPPVSALAPAPALDGAV